MRPAVSVCIPVYNGEPYIRAAIRSVLNQTHHDLELVVVDNRSTDGTVAAVQEFEDPRLRLERPEQHLDAVGNWNRAVEQACAPAVKLVCADDALAPTCLERQLAALGAHAQATLVAGQRDVVDHRGRLLIGARGLAGMRGYVPGRVAIARCVRAGTNVFGEVASVLFRGDALRATGGFRREARYLVDLDLYFRILEDGGLVALPEPLAVFRVHEASWSAAVSDEQADVSRRLFRTWAARPGSQVSRRDLVEGIMRASAIKRGRRLVSSRGYRRVQERRARRAPVAG